MRALSTGVLALLLACFYVTDATAGLGSGAGSGAAGGAAVAAGTGGLNTGAGNTSSTPGSAGGGSNAPIEVEIMTYRALGQIADEMATEVVQKVCNQVPVTADGSTKSTDPPVTTAPGGATQPDCSHAPVLLEDSTMNLQVGLYQSAIALERQAADAHSDLAAAFGVQVGTDNPGVQTFTVPTSGRLWEISNVSGEQLTDLVIDLSLAPNIEIGPGSTCPLYPDRSSTRWHVPTLDIDASCGIMLTPRNHQVAPAGAIEVYVTGPASQSKFLATKLAVAIAPTEPAAKPGAKKPSKEFSFVPSTSIFRSLSAAAQLPTSGAGGTQSGAAASSSPPQWMTNFGTIGTALATLKSGISYSSNSFQPPVQSFSVMLEEALVKKSGTIAPLSPYTSTSILYVDEAAKQLGDALASMQSYNNDITAWTTQCKPATANTQIPAACSEQDINALLTDGSQLITAYTTLLSNASDGSGNPVLLDVLHGAMLYQTFNCPPDGPCTRPFSIQFSVAAAAGSTRTNAIFLVNLFYTPRPSYNAGVVVSFELRNGSDQFVTGGSRVMLYDYNKSWLGGNPRIQPRSTDKCRSSDSAEFCIPEDTASHHPHHPHHDAHQPIRDPAWPNP